MIVDDGTTMSIAPQSAHTRGLDFVLLVTLLSAYALKIR